MMQKQTPGKHRFATWGSLPAMALALGLSLSACGGSSSGGIAMPVGGAPAAQGPSGGTASAPLAGGGTNTPAAGGGATSTPAGPGANTPALQDQIAALEQKGAYPKLDRSADIAGPDANNNGVRDDIEAWIHSQKLGDLQTKALMQKAKALQRTLVLDLNDKGALQSSGDELMASSNCGSLHFSPYVDFSKLAGQIEAMTANTRQRAERYMLYNRASSGSSNTLPHGDTCDN